MFNQYPYININDFNLDWMIAQIRKLRHDVEDFVNMNAIKYADPIDWDITKQYEKNTVVIDANTGVAYLSVAPVPAGVNITRPEYWTVIFDLSQFITAGVKNLANSYESALTYTATVPTLEGGWVVWNGTLYEAQNDIHVGDAYVVGGNIIAKTVESFVADVITAIGNEATARINADNALAADIGTLANLTTTDKSNLVNAINEVDGDLAQEVTDRTNADNAIINDVGTLANLTTSDKSNLVNAINEVDGDLAQEVTDRTNADNAIINDVGTLANLTTSDKSNLVNAINEVDGDLAQEVTDRTNADNAIINDVGTLANLTTTDKSTLVGAINEVNSTGGGAIGKIGDLTNLKTTDKTTVVDSINSLVDSRNEIILNVKDFGAVGDGVTDDSNAIDAALNALPAGGGTIYFPAGNYAISREIDIGDGNAATTANGHASTKQSIKLIGVGCNRGYTPQVTQITPKVTMSAVFNVRGLINNVLIDGFNLYVNGKASYGMFICATNYSTFRNIEIYNPTYCGIALVGGKAPTGNYNTGCMFNKIIVTLNTSSTIGLRLTGDISANNDTWLTTFEDCRFQSMSNTANCTSGEFRFCDNITFIRCHFVTYSSSGRGIDLNALDSLPNNPFPTGLSFIDCSIANTAITEDVNANKRIGVNRFYGYGITDGEVIPPQDTRVVGFDADGVPFNGFGQCSINSIAELAKATSRLPIGCSMPFTTNATVSNGIWGIGGYMGGVMVRRKTTSVELLSFTSGGVYYAEIANDGSAISAKHVNFV